MSKTASASSRDAAQSISTGKRIVAQHPSWQGPYVGTVAGDADAKGFFSFSYVTEQFTQGYSTLHLSHVQAVLTEDPATRATLGVVRAESVTDALHRAEAAANEALAAVQDAINVAQHDHAIGLKSLLDLHAGLKSQAKAAEAGATYWQGFLDRRREAL